MYLSPFVDTKILEDVTVSCSVSQFRMNDYPFFVSYAELWDIARKNVSMSRMMNRREAWVGGSI